MDTEKGWVIAISDETAEDFGCLFYDGVGFSKSGKTAVVFNDQVKAEHIRNGLPYAEAYIKEINRIVPYQYIEESIKRISQEKYGLEQATDIYVMEAIAKDGRKVFEARIVVSDSPEDVLPDGSPFDPDIVAKRAIIMGEARTFEEALTLMLKCLYTMKGDPDNEGEEWKKGTLDE